QLISIGFPAHGFVLIFLPQYGYLPAFLVVVDTYINRLSLKGSFANFNPLHKLFFLKVINQLFPNLRILAYASLFKHNTFAVPFFYFASKGKPGSDYPTLAPCRWIPTVPLSLSRQPFQKIIQLFPADCNLMLKRDLQGNGKLSGQDR